MLKYLLLGRTGSGREFFQHLLEKKGLKIAKSYTTREQRDENDTMHHFINDYSSGKYTERLFEAIHNGNRYFYTLNELENADIIPIDPENVKNICEYFPDTAFRFIEIMAANDDRLKHAVADAEDKLLAEEDFITACEKENDAFCAFEDEAMSSRNLLIPNLHIGHAVNNDFTNTSDVYEFVNKLIIDKHTFENMSKIIKLLGNRNIYKYNAETDRYTLYCTENNTDEPSVLCLSLDNITEQVLIDNNGIVHTMMTWLSLEDTVI
mgnify:CR=1 FL=1